MAKLKMKTSYSGGGKFANKPKQQARGNAGGGDRIQAPVHDGGRLDNETGSQSRRFTNYGQRNFLGMPKWKANSQSAGLRYVDPKVTRDISDGLPPAAPQGYTTDAQKRRQKQLDAISSARRTAVKKRYASNQTTTNNRVGHRGDTSA
jgi:hypothetical protein